MLLVFFLAGAISLNWRLCLELLWPVSHCKILWDLRGKNDVRGQDAEIQLLERILLLGNQPSYCPGQPAVLAGVKQVKASDHLYYSS